MKTSEALRRYLSALTIAQGEAAGQPFNVMPWQRDMLRMFDEPGDFALSMARKNAKTTTLAGILAASVDGPLMQPAADVVLVAASMKQATIAYRAARRFLFPDGKPDRKRFRIHDSTNVASITNRATEAKLEVFGCKPETLAGLQPSLILCDEPASWAANVRDRVIAILKTSMGAIPGARLIATGTRSDDSSHWFEKMLKGDRGIVYTVEDPEVDVLDREAWKAANPSLGHPGFDTLARVLEREAKDAVGDEAAEAHYRAMRLNQGTSEVGDDRMLVKPLDWRACEAVVLPDRVGPLVIAFDLSGGSATSASCGYWPETGRVEGFVLVPELPTLERRGVRDGVGDLYLQMKGRGELIVEGQRVPDFEAMVGEAIRRWGFPDVVTSDPYKVRDLRQALEAHGLGRARFVKRSGGYIHGAEDIRYFRRATPKVG